MDFGVRDDWDVNDCHPSCPPHTRARSPDPPLEWTQLSILGGYSSLSDNSQAAGFPLPRESKGLNGTGGGLEG